MRLTRSMKGIRSRTAMVEFNSRCDHLVVPANAGTHTPQRSF
jgi:hypothetical protein